LAKFHSATQVEKYCRELIPGFDPWATAGDGDTFDLKAACHVVEFFPDYIQHVEGHMAGRPYVLEPHEVAIAGNVFGWKRDDRTRRFREAYEQVGRKNSKTTFGAGCSTYVLHCDNEPGAQIISCAADRDQASLSFGIAKKMHQADADLAARSEILAKSIIVGGSVYRSISSDAHTKHGYNPHWVLDDELHAQPNRDLIDVLTTGMGARRQPFMFHITTAGFDRNSICYEKYDYACKVRDGIIPDRAFLPVIYEVKPNEDWEDETLWPNANPNLGNSISWEFLRAEYAKAKETPSFENTFRRLYLDQWTEQESRWIAMDRWDSCGAPLAKCEGRTCYAGLDLATTTDTTALVLLFVDSDGTCDVMPFYWIPEDKAHERERRDRVPYLTWARQGHIELTPGNVTDYRYIRSRIGELSKRYKIKEIAFDPWNATHLATQLGEEDGFAMVQMRQGYVSISEPSKLLERMILSQQIRHAAHPVLRWQVSNVVLKADPAGNIKPDKQRSAERIDGVVATVMALGRAMIEVNNTSVYETRGLRRL